MLSAFGNSSRTILTFSLSMYLFLKHREGESLTSHAYCIIFQYTELLPCSGKLANASNKNPQNTIRILYGRKSLLVKMVITMTSLFGLVTVA